MLARGSLKSKGPPSLSPCTGFSLADAEAETYSSGQGRSPPLSVAPRSRDAHEPARRPTAPTIAFVSFRPASRSLMSQHVTLSRTDVPGALRPASERRVE